MATEFKDRVNVLAEILMDESEEWQAFRNFHNLGLPFAYGVYMEYFEASEPVINFINQTWDWLILDANITDKGFKTFRELTIALGLTS